MSAEARMSPGPQHLQALQRANAVRLARAELKRRIAEGDISAAEVILRSPWEAASMTVADLLTSQRRWGTTRCRKFLQCIPMPENKTIGSMTDRQRRALAQMLGGTCEPRIARPTSAGTAVSASVVASARRAEDLEPMLAGVA
jgi:hypothetical protein